MKFTKYLALLVLIFIPFLTKPLWCIKMFKGTDKFDSCGHDPDYTYESVMEMN